MAGKRLEKKRRTHLPALLLIFAVTAVLSTGGTLRGVAADSPVETAYQPVQVVEEEPVPQVRMPEEPVSKEPPRLPLFATVPESEAVEDTYFDDVAFLGDSRTEGFYLYSGLEHGAYFYAMGATVESVFTKAVKTEAGELPLLDAMAGDSFGKIYVALGVNELGWAGTELFDTHARLLVERLQADHPEAQLVIQSILPVSKRQEAKGGYVNNARIAEYNGILLDIAEDTGCAYLNVAEAVVDEEGFLRRDWTSDGVHLNHAGCAAWLDYLRTHAIIPIE